MNKGSFSIHEVEFVVQSCPGFHDCSCVGQAADCPLNFCQISTWHHGWRLVIYAHFEACWTPINKLNGLGCFDCSN